MAKKGEWGAKRTSFAFMKAAAIIAFLCIPASMIFEMLGIPFPGEEIRAFLMLVVGIFTPIYMCLLAEAMNKHKIPHHKGIDHAPET